MAALKIYTDDLKTAKAILQRNDAVTRQFFYKECYPLFKSIYDNYYTDCNSCLEFMNEIYILILTPSTKTGHCQLENYRGESSLPYWLKSACLFYCYDKYERKQRLNIVDLPQNLLKDDGEEDSNDRLLERGGSVKIDMTTLEHMDVETVLNHMPNKRYREIVRLLYLEEKTNEETATALGMSMDNYYNKKRLAKAQYEKVRKEVIL